MAFNLAEYEPVEDRIRHFYKQHASGRILTEVVQRGEKDWVVKATVYRDSDNVPAATGYAQEIVGSSPVNRTSALENCETSAIGRALANLGFAAKGRASREEMEKVNRSGAESAERSAGADETERGEVSEQSSQQATLGGGADTTQSAPPSEEAMSLSALIVAAVNDGRVTQLDVIEKALQLLQRNDQAPPKEGIDGRTLPSLGTVILKALIKELDLEEKAGAKA